jgi:hypothetical protein
MHKKSQCTDRQEFAHLYRQEFPHLICTNTQLCANKQRERGATTPQAGTDCFTCSVDTPCHDTHPSTTVLIGTRASPQGRPRLQCLCCQIRLTPRPRCCSKQRWPTAAGSSISQQPVVQTPPPLPRAIAGGPFADPDADTYSGVQGVLKTAARQTAQPSGCCRVPACRAGRRRR